jgi:hypothetical protein
MTEYEWQTRKERIDKKLKSLNPPWKIIKYSDRMDTKSLQRCALEEYPTANGPADYAFFVKGRLLGIIEAKKVGVVPYNVLEQAKRYARGVFQGVGNWDGFRVPFLYATNGEVIWHIDVRDEKNLSRQLFHFHTAEALEEFFENDGANRYAHLRENPIDIEGIRPYQKKAVKAIETAISQGKRSMLVALKKRGPRIMKRVKDIPKEERPREKLVKKGPQALSDVELMAILIGRGIEGHDVMSVANQVLTTIDSNGGTPDCAALQNIAGMGPAKATLIAAALEFARRRIKPEGFKIFLTAGLIIKSF